MLDEHGWVVPFVEVTTAEKLPWATTGAKHSFATQPSLEGYAPLVEAFAREGRGQSDEGGSRDGLCLCSIRCRSRNT